MNLPEEEDILNSNIDAYDNSIDTQHDGIEHSTEKDHFTISGLNKEYTDYDELEE